MDIESIKTYGPIIAAFIGALVGSSIKELSTFYQLRREDKRQLKTCLFNQLELRFEISRYDTSKIADLGVEYIASKLREGGLPEEQIVMMKAQIKPQLKPIVEKIKLGEPEKLREQYQSVVSGMAKIDPILAYKLSGRASIEKFLDLVESMFDEADNQLGIPTGNDNPRIREIMISTLKKKLLDDILSQTKKDIYSVSRRIGYVTLLKAFFTLKKSEKRLQESYNKEMDEMVGSVMTVLQSEIAEIPKQKPAS